MAFLNGVRILVFKQEAEKLANLDAVARAVEAMGSQVKLGKGARHHGSKYWHVGHGLQGRSGSLVYAD